MRFRDRVDAGRQLAARLDTTRLSRPLVLGLPRGGIPVAAEVASFIGAPLDVFGARKIGLPGHEELGIGAVAEGLAQPVVTDLVYELGIDARTFAELAERVRRQLDERVARYRAGRPAPQVAGRDVILVDDGLATGVTAEAALRALRAQEAARLVLAVPVCAQETADRLASVADEAVWVSAPADFGAVGLWYADFSETTDEEVIALLAGVPGRPPAGPAP